MPCDISVIAIARHTVR